MFIANLASTDILLSTSFPFYAVTRITRHWIFGNVLCKSVFYSSIVQAMCSSFTLILISIDRYYCVTINSSWIKRKQIALLLLFVWALSFALSVPSLYSRGEKTVYLQNETFVICTNEWSDMSHSALNSFHTLILFFFLFGPSTTMMVMYFKLYQFIRSAKLRVIQQRSQSKKITKRHVRLVKMFTIIVLLYFMRLLPWLISSVMRMYFSVSSAAHVLALLTSFSTTCLNPIIYGYNNKLLRNGIRRTLCCKWSMTFVGFWFQSPVSLCRECIVSKRRTCLLHYLYETLLLLAVIRWLSHTVLYKAGNLLMILVPFFFWLSLKMSKLEVKVIFYVFLVIDLDKKISTINNADYCAWNLKKK